MSEPYMRPCEAPISDTWQGHLDRTPPSSEPGTDYACAYGTPLVAPDSGWITDTKSSTSGATGRYITLSLDDGRTVRMLHLSVLGAQHGDHVNRGQVIAYSGASANGSDWGVGAHVHVTLWPGPIWGAPTIDFEAHAGTQQPIDWGDDDMIIIQGIERGIALIGPGYYRHIQPSELEFAGALATKHLTGGDHEFDQWKGLALYGEAAVIPSPVQPPADAPPVQLEAVASSSSIAPPLWLGAGILAGIGIIDLIGLIIDRFIG